MFNKNDNVFMGKLKEETNAQQEKIIHQSQIVPGTIKQRHIESNKQLIQTGAIADRPENPTTLFYFATDENKLYFYNIGTWYSVNFS